MMKRTLFLSLAVVCGLSGAVNAALITEWNFNGPANNMVPGGNLSPTPSSGAGTASLAGGATADANFGSGSANSGSSDPAVGTPPDFGWQTTTYPAQGAGDKTRGTAYAVSTVGFKDILIEYDLRHSNTSSRYEQFQYSIDGTTFIDFGAPFDGNAGDTWFNNRSIDLSSVAAVDNNPNFAFRIVSTFAPGGSSYAASNSSGTYAGTGTWRFDMVQVNGTLVPEPASYALALFGIGLIAMLRRNR